MVDEGGQAGLEDFEYLNEDELQQVAGMAVDEALGVWNGVEVNNPQRDEPEGEVVEDEEDLEGEDTTEPRPETEGEPSTRIVWQDLGLRNRMEVDAERGYVWVHTNEARNDLVVPEELPYPYWPHRFQSERYTRCETRDEWGRLQVAEVYDDWRVQGRGRPPIVPWTGATLFVFADGQVPWVELPVDGPGGPDAGGGGEDPGGGDDDWRHQWHSGGSNDWQSLNDSGQWQGWHSWSWRGTRAGGNSWTDFEKEGISGKAATAALGYIQEVDKIKETGLRTGKPCENGEICCWT